MNKGIKLILLAILLAALAVLAPSPALMEGYAPDPAKATAIPLDANEGYPPRTEGYIADNIYQDDTIRVEIQEQRVCDTPVYVARVQLADASQLRTVLAGRYGTQKTALATRMAERSNAVFAINGDYYSYISTGLVVRQGHTWRYREDEELDSLMIDANGDLHVAMGIDRETLDEAYNALGGAIDEGGTILQAFTFGPALVVNGERAHETFVRPDGSENKETQRMVIAQDGPLSYVIVCCEGPDNVDSKGMTLEEMAQFMLSLGVETAYNLDGGGSSTMVFKGEKINARSTSKNRNVSDVICFCSAQAM